MAPFATALGARVTIFHSLPTPRDLEIAQHVVPFHEAKLNLTGAWQSDLEKYEEQAQTFVDALTSVGGKADTFLDCSGMDLIQAIEDYVNLNHVDMVALAAQSGPISNYLTGMTTRKLVRRSACPVWLLHQNPSSFVVEGADRSSLEVQGPSKDNPAA
jgi:nucleotide-binding universal stress UspA family protein